ncbi:MAG: DinB family protein [Acidobacteriota bacterium]|nr:DinB family protein [Acidobacteriota bacterium]
MRFTVEKTIEILERTPSVLETMLQNVSADWTENNEGGETWSVFDVLGHLVHGEKTDWVGRMEIILSDAPDKRFEPFDRFAQFEESKGKMLSELLEEFKSLRKKNVAVLRSKKLTAENLEAKGVHPAFGEVTLAQLLATWTVHDLDHIAQISRVMAKQYKAAVGPWKEYLKILNL